MTVTLRPYTPADYQPALDICIAAFAPIHEGFAEALGPKVFALQYHDWKERYAETFNGIASAGETTKVYVAEVDGAVAGFVFTVLDAARKTGEIGLNAVDPKRQGRGVGRAMYAFALADLKSRGAEIAYVGTGGDVAHGSARRAYEAVGFDKVIPSLHLFKTL
ncbi:MAG: GNAT family N-acetyltransferase [Rhodospirillaceae bacterium]|nr:GNAT family N-acetyltransferase [Rhodospirillaceae bacterium]